MRAENLTRRFGGLLAVDGVSLTLERGRLHAVMDGASRGPRDAFQRDRDRIIHSRAFRKLRHKTQVFIAPDDDHFRVRLTHSLEVAQIARTIARALALNEDLTEALALAHDIGHPPFGHAGEDALKAALAEHGGWDHNAHTVRTLTRIEQAYPGFSGLNLSWEVLEGLAKHNGPVAHPAWALVEYDALHPLELTLWPSLEAQVAALADDIAYDNHDIDDGLRSGILKLNDLMGVPFISARWARLCDDLPGVPEPLRLRELVRDMIGAMVNDLIETSRTNIARLRVQSPEDVRAAGRAVIGFSPAMADAERAVKAMLYSRLYHAPQQILLAEKARAIIGALFDLYAREPGKLPEDWRAALPEAQPARARYIADFIAGMTDRYAIARYEELIGPTGFRDGF